MANIPQGMLIMVRILVHVEGLRLTLKALAPQFVAGWTCQRN